MSVSLFHLSVPRTESQLRNRLTSESESETKASETVRESPHFFFFFFFGGGGGGGGGNPHFPLELELLLTYCQYHCYQVQENDTGKMSRKPRKCELNQNV